MGWSFEQSNLDILQVCSFHLLEKTTQDIHKFLRVIYILFREHKICRNLLTPRRDHLLFPNDDGKGGQHSTRSKTFGSLPEDDKVELSKGIYGDTLSGDPINKNGKNLPGNVFKRNLSSSSTFSKNVGTSKCKSLMDPSPIMNTLAQLNIKRMTISSMKRIPENVLTGGTALRTAEMKNRYVHIANS